MNIDRKSGRRTFLAAAGALGAAALPQFHGRAVARQTEDKSPPFSLGLVTYNIAAAWDLPTILSVCRKVGIGPVELRTTHRHGVEPSLSPDKRKEIRQRIADSGVALWGLGSVCEFHSKSAAEVDRNVETCKQFVQLCADLGGRGVKVRPNGLPGGVPVDKTLQQIGKALVRCGEAAKDAGVEIWVEVHGSGTALPGNMQKILQHCGHPSVGICWNSNRTDLIGGSVEPAFKMLSPWIRSCHINTLYADSTGSYPYRELFSLLRKSGYDRTTLIELGKGMPDVASSEEFLKYYKALWSELARG